MEPTGPVPGSMKFSRPQGNSSTLRPGMTVVASIVSLDNKGGATVRIGGQTFRAVLSAQLRPGDSVSVRVSTLGSRLILTPVSEFSDLPTGELARQAGLPSDTVSLHLVRSFMQAGLPLDPSRLGQARSRIQKLIKLGYDPERLARSAARLERLGLLDTPAFWDAWIGAQSGDQRGESRDARQRRRRGDDAPTENDVRNAFSASDTATNALQITNHTVGSGDHWMIIPVSVPGIHNAQVTLRLAIVREFALGLRTDVHPIREGRLEIETEDQVWDFQIIPNATGGYETTLLRCDGVEPSDPLVARLLDRTQEKLRAFSSDLTVRNPETPGSLGVAHSFSSDSVADIIPRVDDQA